MLRWTIERELAGAEGPLKEYEIGLAVLGKRESWDPRIDPIVRVEFSRMRRKLRDYQAGEGAKDAVVIEFPARSYGPVFHWRMESPDRPSEQVARPVCEPPAPAIKTRVLPRRWLFALALVAIVLGAALLGAWHRLQPFPPVTTIAVLPLVDLTPDRQHGYLSTGLTEELTNSLETIRELRVIAPASSFRFKGKRTDARSGLGAGAVLEGSFAAEGERIRIDVRLHRTSDDAILWQARFDRDAQDIVGAEDEIAQSVRGALGIRSGPAPGSGFDPGQQAFDAYMKGIDAERKSDPASLRMAQADYDDAIRLSPRYALAHARLGSIHLALSGETGPSQMAELQNARQELETAVSLDSKLPIANAGLALVNYLLNWDWPAAEAGFRRALSLGSSSAAHQTYAWALMTRGRFAESERHYREAIQLDPLNCLLHYNLATLFSRERRGAAAAAEVESCLGQNPEWFLGRMALGYFELFEKHPDQGLNDLHRAAALAPGTAAIEPGLVIGYAESGRRGEALALMQRLDSRSGTRNYVRYQLAEACAYLGDGSRLFDWLRQSVDFHEQQALNMRIDPALAPYQKDPRMIALEQRVGLIP